MSGECQVNVKSQSELDIGGRETCFVFTTIGKISSFHPMIIMQTRERRETLEHRGGEGKGEVFQLTSKYDSGFVRH